MASPTTTTTTTPPLSSPSSPPFEVLHDTKPDDTTLPAFMVSTARGFLPRMDPVAVLPPAFDAVESLLQRMPVRTASGAPGLLADGRLGDAVLAELPDLTAEVDRYSDNLPLMNALYRDYSFLASAYLLEPCHLRFMRGEPYGLGRSVLPAQLSRPIARCAELYVESCPVLSHLIIPTCLIPPLLPLPPTSTILLHPPSHSCLHFLIQPPILPTHRGYIRDMMKASIY